MKIFGYDFSIKKTETFAVNSDGQVKEKILPRESQIITANSFYGQFQQWNPDDIYRKRNSFEIYYEMLRDYQVGSLVELRKNYIIGSGFEIEAPLDSEGNELDEYSDVVNFVRDNLENYYDGSLAQDLLGILSAHDFGFSVAEIIYKLHGDKMMISNISQINPDSIRFKIDDFGEINAIEQYQKNGLKELNQDKLVVFSWNKRDGNIWGESALRPIYNIWFTKQQIMKFWAICLERYGMPFALGKYDPEKISTEEAKTLQALVSKMQSASAGIVPNSIEIDFVELAQHGPSSFLDAINKFDQMIATALLVPDLMGMSGKIDRGSQALGNVHYDVFLATIERYRKLLEENIVNEQIIKPLVDLNFSNIKSYPKFKLGRVAEKNNIENVKIFIELLKINKFVPSDSDINFIRETLDFPQSEVILVEPTQPTMGNQNNQPNTASITNNNGPIPEKKPNPDISNQRKLQASDKMTFFEKGVDFKKIEADLNEKEQIVIGRIGAILKKAKADLISTVREKRVVENKDLEFAQNIKFDFTANIRTIFEKAFIAITNSGIADARAEIENQRPKKMGISNEVNIGIKAAKEFLKKLAMTKAFQAAGDLSDNIRKEVRNVLIEGIKSGSTTSSIVSGLENAFSPYVEGAVIPGSSIDPYRLETIARTNISTFYNEGRLAGFNEAVNEGYITHYQFSAILDSRTTEICSEANGTVIPATDADAVSILQPPLHFSCRSVLLPITEFRQDEMNQGIEDGDLKSGLTRPPDFYDGF